MVHSNNSFFPFVNLISNIVKSMIHLLDVGLWAQTSDICCICLHIDRAMCVPIITGTQWIPSVFYNKFPFYLRTVQPLLFFALRSSISVCRIIFQMWFSQKSFNYKMSNRNIIRLMDLGIKRLNSKEDFDAFQSFVTQELDLDTVSRWTN